MKYFQGNNLLLKLLTALDTGWSFSKDKLVRLKWSLMRHEIWCTHISILGCAKTCACDYKLQRARPAYSASQYKSVDRFLYKTSPNWKILPNISEYYLQWKISKKRWIWVCYNITDETTHHKKQQMETVKGERKKFKKNY